MQKIVGALILFFLGAISSAWYMKTQSDISASNLVNENNLKIQQLKSSINSMKKSLKSCNLNSALAEKSGNKVPITVEKTSSNNSISSSSLSSTPFLVEKLDTRPKMRLEYLDEKIADAPPDTEWTEAVDSSVASVLSEWSGSKQNDIHCSQFVCRVEIRAGSADQAEKIIDGLNNIKEVQGERMIQFDEKNEYAVVYFGRNGNISLLSGDGF